jgi:hypothetical protein
MPLSEVIFEAGGFGWEVEQLSSVNEKASYLYTAVLLEDKLEDLREALNVLTLINIPYTFIEPNHTDFYIDHSSELGSFVDDLLKDSTLLMNYLFSPLSFVLTGNDNDDHSVDIEVTYPHKEYYKGN